ncbi:hypothetical protein A8L34_24975 [Bacillus sp. FJAT-27264]|uniref:FkbM family methyltransferase n=1 Tax=Paenibacillus sp. (strain DSM 101736 / FJAT-27264) TaxID=1850362 RepID=UPI000807B8CA|nr:FkbM family methyltransferase [Bacillus sp. FJAT-27264]OBZ07886.1 hypothetical protein A8L34_24975 [Bacillus sp. FJAT-27264]
MVKTSKSVKEIDEAFFSLDKLVKETTSIKYLENIRSQNPSDRPVILFGAGAWGKICLRAISEYFNKVLFCDTNSTKWGSLFEGVTVISPNQLIEKYSDSYIIIASLDYFDQIYKQLSDLNLQEQVLLPLRGFDPFVGFENYYKVVEKHFSEFENIYNLLEDAESKQLFKSRINSCITFNNKYIIPFLSDSPQYFETGLISLSNDEVFVDCGAYTGDTAEEFIKQTEGNFKKIYSFEPEESKHKHYLEKFSDDSRVELLPYGVWKENDTLKFNALDNVCSSFEESGDIEIKVVSIDDSLELSPVTFMKMDIEGSELEALRGAEETIRKYKPKLAICIYHKPLDIVQIPQYLKEIVPEYKIYLRHYSMGIGETVCYAIAE